MSEEKIKKAMPAKRPTMSFELQHAIIIPKGTILRQEPDKLGFFTVPVANGVFTVEGKDGLSLPATYKRVISG